MTWLRTRNTDKIDCWFAGVIVLGLGCSISCISRETLRTYVFGYWVGLSEMSSKYSPLQRSLRTFLTHGFDDSAAPVYCIIMLSILSSASGSTKLILPAPVFLSNTDFGSRDVPSATLFVDLLRLRFPLFAVLSLELRPVNPWWKSSAPQTTTTLREFTPEQAAPPPGNAFADNFPWIFAFGLSSLARKSVQMWW
jgi:hypothetical protein